MPNNMATQAGGLQTGTGTKAALRARWEDDENCIAPSRSGVTELVITLIALFQSLYATCRAPWPTQHPSNSPSIFSGFFTPHITSNCNLRRLYDLNVMSNLDLTNDTTRHATFVKLKKIEVTPCHVTFMLIVKLLLRYERILQRYLYTIVTLLYTWGWQWLVNIRHGK